MSALSRCLGPLLLLGLGTGVPVSAAAAVTPSSRFEPLSSDFERTRELLRVPGLAAAIVENGRVVWRRDIGLADLEKRVPVTEGTEFCIASVTKTMAAIVLLQMVHERRLRLDDPIARYTDEPSIPKNVTIRHVLSHTSDGNPGEEFLYNGARYAMLTRVIERVGGQSFQQLLISRIFKPLRMAHAIPGLGADRYAKPQAKLARPYRLDDAHQISPGMLPQPGVKASTGVVSTIQDLARYAIALDRGSLVPRREAALMFSPTRSTSSRNLPYGLGCSSRTTWESALFGTSGKSKPTAAFCCDFRSAN